MRIIILTILFAFLAAGCGGNKEKNLSPEERISLYKLEIEKNRTEIKNIEVAIAGLKKEITKLGGSMDEPKDTILITLNEAKQENFEEFLEIAGVADSRQNVLISSETGGRILSIPVSEGQQVSAGTRLVNLDAEVILNNIEELNTALDLASTVYEKRKKLWDQNIGSEIDFLQAKNNKESLERKLETAKSQLQKAYISAPFNGVVDEIFLNSGEMSSPGAPILRLVNLNKIQIKADVSEAYIGKVKRGDEVTVLIPATGYQETARISSVGQVLNSNNRTFKVEINMSNTKGLLRPNQLAQIKIRENMIENQVIIPTRLIQQDLSGHFVYTVSNGIAKRQSIVQGPTYEGKTIISKGLKEGEKLVDSGYRNVFNGASVKVQSN
jgi:RND family efflux transporter MFP subunit